MGHAEPLPFLRETLLFLALAGLLIPLLQRFRVNQVIGFLVIGTLVGPFGAGSLVERWPAIAWVSIPRRQGVDALAELGVIFLMFLIGLEMSLARVWAMRRWVLGAGSAQLLGSAALIALLAMAFGNRLQASLVLGAVLSLSSTAVVMQLMAQRRSLASPMGQATFSVLMLQDLAVVPLLIGVDLLARGSAQAVVDELVEVGLRSVVVVGLILVVGRRVVAPLFRTFARQRQPEVFVALTLLVALSTAGATALAGLSTALGAFLAGLLLAETEFRHEVAVTVEPFKGLLMGLFFMSVGMAIDPGALANDPVWLAGSVAGLLLLKAALVAAIFRAGGLSWGAALEGGALLGQGGEFAFIVIGTATGVGLIDARTGQFMLLVVSLSLLATPPFARAGQRLGRWVDARARSGVDASAPPVPDVAGHVVVIGFGRVGQLLADVFDRQRVPWLAVEHDHDRMSRQHERGRPVLFGNAARPELLHRLDLGRAACLLVTMDQPVAARRVVQAAREAFPALPIFARSHDEAHARELREAGATAVVPETLEAGLFLAAQALEAIGLPDVETGALLASEREHRLRMTRAQADSGRA